MRFEPVGSTAYCLRHVNNRHRRTGAFGCVMWTAVLVLMLMALALG